MIASHIAAILVVSGAATAGLVVMAAAPRLMTRLVFGVDATDGLTVFFARYLGLLVFLVGCLLIYSAFHPEVRAPVLIFASVEKLFFVALIAFGGVSRTPLMLAAGIADGCFALLYLAYLAGR